MTDVALKFTREEYAQRLAKTRRAMEAKGVDLLIVTDPSNMNWLTGYDGWSFYVHQCVVVPPDGEPIFFGRAMDAVGARFTAYLAEANIIGYPDDYVMNTQKHPMDLLSQILTDKGWGTRRIGVEMDNYWFTAAAFAAGGAIDQGLFAQRVHLVDSIPRAFIANASVFCPLADGAGLLNLLEQGNAAGIGEQFLRKT